RASLEAQLRESQKMEAIGTLAGGIAHDFNNIVATIIGNADLAKEEASANPALLESIGEIRKAAARARDLVQQILSFSRRQPTEVKCIALAPMVLESARLLRATVPRRVTLDVHCEPDVPPVLADATQIQQALINLATNALHAIPSGTGRINITLGTVMLDEALAQACPRLRDLYTKNPGLTVRIAVSDNGGGMSAATLERIFEPFFTTKPVNQGTGLGLSVVHGIVEGHGGAIVVDSELGKGSSFSIYLPAAAASMLTPEPSNTLPAAELGQNEGLRVLYIDDDELLVSIVTRMLGRRGYRVSAHTDQLEALDLLRADPAAFDLVLTDYNMPGMSGLDVAREVRSMRATLPVMVTSGNIDDTLRAQAADAGVRELISKADWADELYAAVERMTKPSAI
ncbi:MAG TPA: ATP-binding protein, partial [Burkholderiales bacterium]|nr:ATP-binding protein [Burkholderiales bacterium]